MTKQELINITYLKYVNPSIFNDMLKMYIDYNTGWLNLNYPIENESMDKVVGRLFNNFQKNGSAIRPYELKGLEHNNGWTCITVSIPKEVVSDNLVLRFANGEIKRFGEEFSMFNTATHWRVVDPLPQPLWNDEFTEFFIREE